MGCPASAHDHSCTPQRQSHGHNPRAASQPAAVRDLLQDQHAPPGWKGCFPFPKRFSPCSRHQAEMGRSRQGPHSPVSSSQALTPTTLAHSPGACSQKIGGVVGFFFFFFFSLVWFCFCLVLIWQALTHPHLHISVLLYPSSSFYPPHSALVQVRCAGNFSTCRSENG